MYITDNHASTIPACSQRRKFALSRWRFPNNYSCNKKRCLVCMFSGWKSQLTLRKFLFVHLNVNSELLTEKEMNIPIQFPVSLSIFALIFESIIEGCRT